MISWIIMAITLVGTVLNIQKNRIGFIFWGVSNTLLIWLNWHLQQPGLVAMYTVFLGTCFFGWIQWGKQKP